jgi:hypothetical protein
MGKVDHHKDLSDHEDELAVSATVVQGLPSHPPYPNGEQAAVCAGANTGQTHGCAGTFCTASPLLSIG